MRAIFTSSRLVSAAAACIAISLSPPVSAQTIGTGTITLPIANTIIPRAPLDQRNNPLFKPNWINRADCIADEKLTFALGLANYAGLVLEGWVGTSSCSDISTRTGSDPTCWLVYRTTPSAALPNNTLDAVIRGRDIVGQQLFTQGGEPPDVPVAPASVCDNTNTTSETLVLDFMLLSGTTVSGTVAEWTDMGFDIVPPDPPTGVFAGVGDTRLHLSWTTSDSIDLYQYNFFCEPTSAAPGPRYFDASPGSQLIEAGMGGTPGAGGAPKTDAGAADASLDGSIEGGVTGAGGTGGAGTVTTVSDASFFDASFDSGALSVCAPTVLVPGSDPVVNDFSKYACGSVNGLNATAGTASGLTDNVLYVVTVSGVDNLQNVGPLSNTSCATPVQLTDFFNLYRQLGGKGGGGFCSVALLTGGARNSAAVLFGLAALGVARRRRRPS